MCSNASYPGARARSGERSPHGATEVCPPESRPGHEIYMLKNPCFRPLQPITQVGLPIMAGGYTAGGKAPSHDDLSLASDI